MTLVEVAVAGALISLVATATYSMLNLTQTSVNKQVAQSATIDELRIALTQIERQVRSGNLFYDPSSEVNAAHGLRAGLSLRVYTQNNATTAEVPNRCILWRITPDGALETREWEPFWSAGKYATGFRQVAEGLINNESLPAFSLDTSQPHYGNRLLKIVLVTNTKSNERGDARVELFVTGRNTGYGYPVRSCDTIPDA